MEKTVKSNLIYKGEIITVLKDDISFEKKDGTEVNAIREVVLHNGGACALVRTKENKIMFDVTRYGHGDGMSQAGANTDAKAGYTYDQIIHHYYTNVDIVDGYNVQMKRGEIWK